MNKMGKWGYIFVAIWLLLVVALWHSNSHASALHGGFTPHSKAEIIYGPGGSGGVQNTPNLSSNSNNDPKLYIYSHGQLMPLNDKSLDILLGTDIASKM